MTDKIEIARMAEKADAIARGIAIACECLAGDPFREVPDLAVAAYEVYLGPMRPREAASLRGKGMPAFAVACIALGHARMAAGPFSCAF